MYKERNQWSDTGVASSQINQWKKLALKGLPELFSRKNESSNIDPMNDPDHLRQVIGKLQVEVEWLKKKSKQLGLM